MTGGVSGRTHCAENAIGDFSQRRGFAQDAAIVASSRHPVDGAAGSVLSQGITTSGRSELIFASASSPLCAVPMTLSSSSDSIIRDKEARMNELSSAMSTVVFRSAGIGHMLL